MKKKIIAFILLSTVFTCFAQVPETNYTDNYINGVFYYKRLDYMRESYDRWRMIMKDYHPDEDVKNTIMVFFRP